MKKREEAANISCVIRCQLGRCRQASARIYTELFADSSFYIRRKQATTYSAQFAYLLFFFFFFIFIFYDFSFFGAVSHPNVRIYLLWYWMYVRNQRLAQTNTKESIIPFFSFFFSLLSFVTLSRSYVGQFDLSPFFSLFFEMEKQTNSFCY
jgi:hypothetical protein